MNENYLLHSETAKKLYFEYARNLPVIFLDKEILIDKTYNNVAEVFLLNDQYKLEAMYDCGIDKKFIWGDASDYEKFREFCKILPNFIIHPLYLTSHIELQKNFSCYFDINEENCDKIWEQCNDFIYKNQLSLFDILKNSSTISVKCITLTDIIDYALSRKDVETFEDYEAVIIDSLKIANENGCKNMCVSFEKEFIKPNPYAAKEVFNKLNNNPQVLTYQDHVLLRIQILRTVGIACKQMNWTWLLKSEGEYHDTLDYLEKNNALPKFTSFFEYELCLGEKELVMKIDECSKKHPLGKITCSVDATNLISAYARNDYFRRVLCNIFAQLIDNKEYTSNERLIHNMIENISYYNLKEAIS